MRRLRRRASVFMVVVLGVLLGAAWGAEGSAAQDYELVTAWGSQGSGEGRFNGPSDVAIDSVGNVYVADTGNDRIQKFGSGGSFIDQWGTQGAANGQLQGPSAVDAGTTAGVYVADRGNDQIKLFDRSGGFDSEWGPQQFAAPTGVATASGGRIWVADRGDNSIIGFSRTSASNAFQCKFFSPVNGGWAPDALAADLTDQLFVADSRNHRIFRYGPAVCMGNQDLFSWGTQGSAPGQLEAPTGIATDAAGDVYVADTGNDRIQRFGSDGTFVATWGSRGTGDGRFRSPTGLAVDDAGNVYVVDTGNNRIQKFAPAGAPPPPPTSGKTVNVEPDRGKVKTKCKGEKRFTKLKDAEQIPLGCLLDTRRGRVSLTSADPDGSTQTASFYKGIFRVKQKAGAETELKLAGRLSCKKGKGKPGRRVAELAGRGKRGKGGRGLWGKGKGKFKTKGKNGSATVRGTTWFVGDRCDGSTLFKVKDGTVEVRDDVKKTTLQLEAGERYVAGPRRGS